MGCAVIPLLGVLPPLDSTSIRLPQVGSSQPRGPQPRLSPAFPPPGVPRPQELLVPLRHPIGPAEQLHPPAEEDVGRSFQVGVPLSAGAPGRTRDLPGVGTSWASESWASWQGLHCPLASGKQFCLGTQFRYLAATRLGHTGDFPGFTRQPHYSVLLKSKRVGTEPPTHGSSPGPQSGTLCGYHPSGQFRALGSKIKWISTHPPVCRFQGCPPFPQGKLPNLPEAVRDLLR